jgi:hypothetical protein
MILQMVRTPRRHLDLSTPASQTKSMSHIYLKFDFGTDEEKVQEARHKLDVWKQAFRLDKKLQYILDRPETPEVAAGPVEPEKPAKSEKPAAAEKPKGKGKSAAAVKVVEKPAAASNGKVSLVVRLYFSSHERLSEQRWLDRIPIEEPFKTASPKIIRQNDAEFEASVKHFEDLSNSRAEFRK